MMFLIRAVLLHCKRLFRRRGTVAIAMMLLLCCTLMAAYQRGAGEVLSMRVGVVVSPGDSFGEGIYDSLERFESPIVFERYAPEDLPILEQEIETGGLQCAFVLSPDFRQSLSGNGANGSIELIKSPHTVVGALAGELLYASVLREYLSEITSGLLQEVLDIGDETAAGLVAESFAYYEENGDIFLQPIYRYSGQEGEESPRPDGRFFHGVVALFLLAGMLYALPPLLKETPSLLRRMSLGKAVLYDLGLAVGLIVTGVLQVLPAFAAVWILFPDWLAAPGWELAWLLVYQAALAFGATAATLLLRRANIVHAGGVFLLLLTVVFGGVVFDPAEISCSLAVVAWVFPSSGYIAGVTGGSAMPLFLLLATGILLTLLLTQKARGEWR